MPVAKGAAYLLSSVNQKKNAKLRASEAELSESTSLLEAGNQLAAKERRALRRRSRGCRHCRRNHDVRLNPIHCKPNMYVKCIGCGKILVNNLQYPRSVSIPATMRSCCSEFYGKLSKVKYLHVCRI